MANTVDKQTENTIKEVDNTLYKRWFEKNKNFLRKYISENLKIEIDNEVICVKVEGEVVGISNNVTTNELRHQINYLMTELNTLKSQETVRSIFNSNSGFNTTCASWNISF